MRRLTFPMMCMGLMLATTQIAQASLMIGGNTRPSNAGDPIQDGSISFAVYSNDGAGTDVFGTGLATFDTTAFTAGTGSPGFDTSAMYLYIYQVVNDGSASSSFIDRFTTFLGGHPSSDVTSWGSFATLGFTDGAAVGPTNPLGNNGVFFGSPPLTRAPADTSGALPATTVAAVGGLVSPTSVVNQAGVFQVNFTTATHLAQGSSSALLVFTSNLKWSFANGSIQDGSSTNGTVTSLVPGPSGAAMIFSLLPLLLLGGFIHRRRMTVNAST